LSFIENSLTILPPYRVAFCFRLFTMFIISLSE
jgi:hypothetical protein